MRKSAQPLRRQNIHAHVECHIGRIEQVFQNPDASRDAPYSAHDDIEVLHVAPDPALPYHLLVTAGMSDQPMILPADKNQDEAPSRLELMMILPQQWSLAGGAQDERYGWPIRWLGTLARYPRIHNLWLGWGDVVPNGNPPRPFVSYTRQCGAILAPSLQVPVAFYELGSGPDRIAFYAAIPLYLEEMALRQREGMEVLFTKLLEHDIRDIVDCKRRNVAKRFFGLF
ncbi:suppressor of fused domain protein [Steroidobacter denitrificans]|uniref:suppressor of fused domain protein n=1 Tax=Steroidobacter denitrificans TaxID=465721 RepID=UPI001AEFC923|nr:suppressor of fused domain protein [Steroidobacter denitrificans]